MRQAIADDVRLFVRAHIRSMLQLEALMVLARDPERWWSATMVNLEVRASLEASSAQLERLHELGLLDAKDEGERLFRFNPRVPEHTAIVSTLMEMHRERFHTLIDLIYARDRARDFADAFKLKKSSEGDDG